MKIGITGGLGFIGQYVCEEAEKRGHDVVVMDRQKRDTKYELFLGDIRDATAMTEFAAHVDGIIHLAAVLGTQETIGNPRPAAETNVLGGINFLEACAQYDIPGVYICVGNRGMYATYSLTKSLVEDFCFMYNKYRGTKINQVRAMNAYGPRQSVAAPFGNSKVRKITPSFICRALTGMDVEVYGNGEQISDMVYVGDVAEALVTALEKAHKGIVFNEVVEIGPQDNKTVNEVAETVIKLAESTSKIVHLPMRPGEKPDAVVKANYFTLGLVDMDVDELVSLEDGMKQTIEYYRTSQGEKWNVPKL